MINQNLSQKGSSHILLVVISVLVLIIALGLTLWRNFYSSNTTPEVKETTLELSGMVTKKNTSCGTSTLREDGTIKRGAGICDSGESIVVNDKSIATSSGGPGVNGFSKDIDSIDPGDEVTVHYIISETGRLTLDCQSCSVIRTKHIDRAESF